MCPVCFYLHRCYLHRCWMGQLHLEPGCGWVQIRLLVLAHGHLVLEVVAEGCWLVQEDLRLVVGHV